jgi:hypothetical protein
VEHHLRYAVNCSMLFTELPLLSRPAAAREAGFDAIELWWPFPTAVPKDADVDRFVAAVRDAGVRLVGLNFAAGDMPGGDRGLVSWPARSSEIPLQRLKQVYNRRSGACSSPPGRRRAVKETAVAAAKSPLAALRVRSSAVGHMMRVRV